MTHDTIIASFWRRFDDVIIASCAHWDYGNDTEGSIQVVGAVPHIDIECLCIYRDVLLRNGFK